MSDYHSIAMVTAALRSIVQGAVDDAVPEAKVYVGPPNEQQKDQTPEVTLYLYQVTANAEIRNHDLPRWGADGQIFQRPQAAVNLRYLISFTGAGIQPELMMGKVVSHFHGLPQVSRKKLADLALNPKGPPAGAEKLKDANLALQHDTISITPSYLDFEETSKLWSSFFQVRHRRSLMYEVHPLMIDSTSAAVWAEVFDGNIEKPVEQWP